MGAWIKRLKWTTGQCAPPVPPSLSLALSISLSPSHPHITRRIIAQTDLHLHKSWRRLFVDGAEALGELFLNFSRSICKV